MRLTIEQFKALTPYRTHFETMVRAKWTRHPGNSALDLMHEIYGKITGSKTPLNKGCSRCIKNLVGSLGKIYLEDAKEWEEMEKAVPAVPEDDPSDPDPAEVAVKESLTTETTKVEVKTKRKYNRKPKA